ncbi:unnamed protein product [Calypogeia fissa]
MKSSKYSKTPRPWSWKGMFRNQRHLLGGGVSLKLGYNALTLIILAGISGLVIMLCKVACYRSSGMMAQMPNWDEKRTMWMDQHPDLKPEEGQKPRIMMVTGSSPKKCELAVSTHGVLRAAKNKVDYCRVHGIPLYYSMGIPDRNLEFSSRFSADWWVTLPIIRMLMFDHPEVEWIWWVDADAVFTDMSLEPPFAELKDDHNLVLFREIKKTQRSLHTGNYLIRNCQWTLDLIRLWESASSQPVPDYKLSSISPLDLAAEENLQNKFDNHKSMVTQFLSSSSAAAGEGDSKRQTMVKETESWAVVAPHLEDLQVKLQQKQDLGELPLLTHFAGCMPCSTPSPVHPVQQEQQRGQEPSILTIMALQMQKQAEDICLEQLDRTFDFADNQVYHLYGFERRALGTSKMEALSKHVAEGRAITEDGVTMWPKISDWDKKRSAHIEKSATAPRSKDKVILVSGSAPKPCGQAVGGQMLVRGLKNKIDYCRLHGIELFYNMAVVDKDLTGWWSKLVLLRMLMLKNPGVEWLWWMDSDAVITNMGFEIPFESKYNVNGGYNLVMYGQEDLLYEEKIYTALNTGNFFIRNCQWSIDLLDRWASFAATPELIEKNGELLSNFLTQRPANSEADDQSVLVYVLITERERWSSKVLWENTEVVMSGNWWYWTPKFLDNVPLVSKPFVTHFAGCTPCASKVTEKCLAEMDRTYHFADNQVLQSSGRCHEHLGSPDIVSSCSIRAQGM